jgi:hypothetical protein
MQVKKSISSRPHLPTKVGNAVYVAGATILHELCHWGNHNNVPPVPEVIEMGAEFEKYTYGKVIY